MEYSAPCETKQVIDRGISDKQFTREMTRIKNTLSVPTKRTLQIVLILLALKTCNISELINFSTLMTMMPGIGGKRVERILL